MTGYVLDYCAFAWPHQENVYSSRTPVFTLGFSRVCVLRCVSDIYSQFSFVELTNDFRLTVGGRLFPSLYLLQRGGHCQYWRKQSLWWINFYSILVFYIVYFFVWIFVTYEAGINIIYNKTSLSFCVHTRWSWEHPMCGTWFTFFCVQKFRMPFRKKQDFVFYLLARRM